MLQAGSIVELMLGSNFQNPGFLNSNPGVIQSFVSKGVGSAGGKSLANGQMTDSMDFLNNESMLLMLRSWTLTQSILGVIKTTLFDIYSNADPKIETGVPKLNDEINEFIKSIGLINNIFDNIEDDLYYGQRAFYVDYEAKAIVALNNQRNFDQVRYLGKPFKYRFGTNDKNAKKDLIEYQKICSIIFNPRSIGYKQSDKPIISSDKLIDGMICDLEYFRGQSVLSDVIYLLFQHFLKSLLSSLLSLKNTVKPNLLKAEIQPGTNQELNIVEAINNIESLLNSGDYTFDFRSSSASAVVASIYNAIVNSVKVVPGISNYTNFDIIQQPDDSAKIESLNNDIEKLQTNILNLKGIPEEIFGGSANRWEIIQRSTRYYNFIKSLSDAINLTIRSVAKSYISVVKDTNVSIDSISLNLGSYNALYSVGITGKLQSLSESLDKLSQLFDTVNKFKENGVVNEKELATYIKDYLLATDSQLAKLLDYDKLIAKPSSGDSGSEGGQW